LTPTTIIGSLSLLAAAAGIGLADSSLALPAVIVLALYAGMNIFLARMLGVWMERWMANRRFREFFGVLMALFAAGIQFLNVQHSSKRHAGVHNNWIVSYLHGSDASLQWLPPGFAANAILSWVHPFEALAQFILLFGSAALFAAIFAIRLRKQFLGEYLSEGVSRRTSANAAVRTRESVPAAATISPASSAPVLFPSALAACVRKEILILRGNSTQLIGLLTPLVFVVIFSRNSSFIESRNFLPGAIAYVLIGLLTSLYNIFGADGPGVQMYLLTPVRLRDVVVAKNLVSLGLIASVASIAWGLIAFVSLGRIALSTQIATLFWTIFAVGVNLALGTLRSIQAPRRFVPGKTPQRGASPVNRTSGLLVLAVLFGSLALQLPVALLCRFFQAPWLAVWIYGPLAVAAAVAYALVLGNAERLILVHRDTFVQELCKA
jgi:ABC-2 type transport system permease protein